MMLVIILSKFFYCNNNNIENIYVITRFEVVFLFRSLFPVFPRIQTVACLFYSQSDVIGSCFLYSPRRQSFSDLFAMSFYWLFFG